MNRWNQKKERLKGYAICYEHRSNFGCIYMPNSLSWYNSVKYLQIFILFVQPKHLGSSGANYAGFFLPKHLRIVIIVQYIPRLCRFLPMLISPTGLIFESPWASFFINLFTFMLSGHVVGSWWYLFGLQVG